MGLFRRREPLHERLAREAGLLELAGVARRRGPRGRRRGSTACTGRASGMRPSPPTRPASKATRSASSRFPTARCSSRTAPTARSSRSPPLSSVQLPPAVPRPGDAPGRDPLGDPGAEDRGDRAAATAPRARRSTSRTPPTARRSPSTTPASSARCPPLEARGEREGREYTVHAERLDGDLWEIRAAAL